MRYTLMLTIVSFLGCGSTADRTPPPVADGKCLVDRYERKVATVQTCVFQGYLWVCHGEECARGDESTGERPTTPGPAVRVQDAGVDAPAIVQAVDAQAR